MNLKIKLNIVNSAIFRFVHRTDCVRCPWTLDGNNIDLNTGCCSFLIEISSNAILVSPSKYKSNNLRSLYYSVVMHSC